jgi:hypothetical protein
MAVAGLLGLSALLTGEVLASFLHIYRSGRTIKVGGICFFSLCISGPTPNAGVTAPAGVLASSPQLCTPVLGGILTSPCIKATSSLQLIVDREELRSRSVSLINQVPVDRKQGNKNEPLR